jgi:hypothetical protein
MATIGFSLAYGNPEVRYIAEADSQTFVVGDLVYLSSGQVTVVADDATIYGVAGKNSANDTNNAETPVYVLDPSQTWIAEADAATTAAYIGEDYGLNVTSGSMSVDIGETTNPAVVIKDLDPRDGASTAAGGRVLINFLPKVLQHMKGAGTSAL